MSKGGSEGGREGERCKTYIEALRTESAQLVIELCPFLQGHGVLKL